MPILSQRDKPPVLAGLLLAERVVAWAECDLAQHERVLVATTARLWWPEPDGGYRHISWHLISKAVWRENTLLVTEAVLVDDLLLVDQPVALLRLRQPRDLPAAVKKRVERSVAHSETATVSDGVVRFVARRVSGQDGLSWWARLESGAQDTPVTREAVAHRLQRLRQAHTPQD